MADRSLSDYWQTDLLGRAEEAGIVIGFIRGRVAERRAAGKTASYVLNLDAGWGKGKTFFLHGLKNQLEHEGAKIVYVNAWEDDHASDPLIAVVAALEKELAGPAGKKPSKAMKAVTALAGEVALSAGKVLALAAGKHLLGEHATEKVAEVGEKVLEGAITKGADKLVETFSREKATIERFRAALASLVKSTTNDGPLFILIDELDRCRPSYAVELLERVKHLFNVNGVAFVIATDTAQLQHAVGAVYGSGFDGAGYLRRFFDRTYRFADTATFPFVEYLFRTAHFPSDRFWLPAKQTPEATFAGLMKVFDISLRDAEQCLDVLRSVVTLWPAETMNDKLKLALLPLCVLIFVQHKAPDLLQACARGVEDSLNSRFDVRAYNLKREVLEDWRRPQSREWETKPAFEVAMLMVREAAQKPLPEITRNHTTKGPLSWVIDYFREEFLVLYANSFDPRMPPMSMLTRYAELVRTAGRLSSSENRA